MLVKIKGVKYIVANDHPYAVVIKDLAKSYATTHMSGGGDVPPERNDVKRLWREMKAKHKALLREVATRGGGVSQADLEGALGVDWQGLRGVHNGLARICERLEIEKPVRATGYNSTNRTYHMDPDVAHTVRGLAKRDRK